MGFIASTCTALPRILIAATDQGRTLVHSSAQRMLFLSDVLGGFSDKNGLGGDEKWTIGPGLTLVHLLA